MGICQIIYLAIIIFGLGIVLAKHGQPKDEKYNFWIQLLGVAIDLSLLYFGGFFK